MARPNDDRPGSQRDQRDQREDSSTAMIDDHGRNRHDKSNEERYGRHSAPTLYRCSPVDPVCASRVRLNITLSYEEYRTAGTVAAKESPPARPSDPDTSVPYAGQAWWPDLQRRGGTAGLLKPGYRGLRWTRKVPQTTPQPRALSPLPRCGRTLWQPVPDPVRPPSPQAAQSGDVPRAECRPVFWPHSLQGGGFQ